MTVNPINKEVLPSFNKRINCCFVSRARLCKQWLDSTQNWERRIPKKVGPDGVPDILCSEARVTMAPIFLAPDNQLEVFPFILHFSIILYEFLVFLNNVKETTL